MRNNETHIWILDDHPLALHAIRTVVEQTAPLVHASTFSSIKSLLIHARERSNPHLIILDWHLPEGSTFELLQKFDAEFEGKSKAPNSMNTQFLILTAGDPLQIETALHKLRSFRPQIVYKNQSMQVLADCVKAMLPSQSSNTAICLTPRQQSMMELIELGMKNLQIASRLCISEHTVKAHLSEIFKKLHVQSRTQAVHKWKTIKSA